MCWAGFTEGYSNKLQILTDSCSQRFHKKHFEFLCFTQVSLYPLCTIMENVIWPSVQVYAWYLCFAKVMVCWCKFYSFWWWVKLRLNLAVSALTCVVRLYILKNSLVGHFKITISIKQCWVGYWLTQRDGFLVSR